MKLNKIKFREDFPKMIWVGDNSLYEKVIFTGNHNEFYFLIEELSYVLFKNNELQQKIN